MKQPITIWEARHVRAKIARQVMRALDVSQHWYEHWNQCKDSHLARANRHAVRCRVMATLVHDRTLRHG